MATTKNLITLITDIQCFNNRVCLFFQNRKLSEDKDKHLQKRVSELQTQVQRLERKISLLNNENDSLVS